MRLNQTIEQRAQFTIQETIIGFNMTSTTARYPIKPKTLTLLELCESMRDFRHPPPLPLMSSNQYQSSSNSAQILTRRLYLHPLGLNTNTKQQSSKTTPTIPPDNDQFNSGKYHEIYPTKAKSAYSGLAVLSSSFPLITRTNTKLDTRHSRDKQSINGDDDTNSDYDTSSTTISFNQPSNLPAIARGTSSSTRTICTRPSCVMNCQKSYSKLNRLEKVDVWHHLDRALQRPIPIDPPTTPLTTIVSDVNTENNPFEKEYSNNYNSIQEIKIYKRNPIQKIILNDNDKDYIFNKN